MLRARHLAGACLTFGCLAAAPWTAAPQPATGAAAPVQKAPFGKTKEGVAVDLYTLTNHHGMVAKVMTYGATLAELHVEDAAGKPANIVLGYDRLEPYLAGVPYFGATVGRVANRIARGVFSLDGKTYRLAANDNGVHHLHGGRKGFDKVVWRAEEVKSPTGPAVKFSYRSPDGDEGYPGTLDVSVTYTLTDANELRLDYHAVADKPTPINLANHSYFNLAGDGAGDILGHVMMIAADRMTRVDERLIPTGEIVPVKGTAWDFNTPTAIGARIKQVPGGPPVGYDHNYVLRKEADSRTEAPIPQLAARVVDPKSGRAMEVLTTEPGMQFYSGNFLDGSLKNRHGVPYRQVLGPVPRDTALPRFGAPRHLPVDSPEAGGGVHEHDDLPVRAQVGATEGCWPSDWGFGRCPARGLSSTHATRSPWSGACPRPGSCWPWPRLPRWWWSIGPGPTWRGQPRLRPSRSTARSSGSRCRAGRATRLPRCSGCTRPTSPGRWPCSRRTVA